MCHCDPVLFIHGEAALLGTLCAHLILLTRPLMPPLPDEDYPGEGHNSTPRISQLGLAQLPS